MDAQYRRQDVTCYRKAEIYEADGYASAATTDPAKIDNCFVFQNVMAPP